tara:strand:+ start:243195 stop:243302 length:108 start_codon:yes stop_codon:yes gene_type:complete
MIVGLVGAIAMKKPKNRWISCFIRSSTGAKDKKGI